MHELAGAGRTFDFEIVAVVMMKLLERFDEKVVTRKPNWAAPVRVAAKNRGLRFGRFVIHSARFAARSQPIRMFLVILADRTHPVVAQEFVRIEHAAQQTFHAMPARDRNEAAFFHTGLLPTRNQTGEIGSVFQVPRSEEHTSELQSPY